MFDILEKTIEEQNALKAASVHYRNMEKILENVRGLPGEKFVRSLLRIFSLTGSPIFVNLDHNVSQMPLSEASTVTQELKDIVKATAGHVIGYKMNFQSLLTFLIAGVADFPQSVRRIYRRSCQDQYGVEIEPVVWLDQKLSDIPNTNFEAADILYKLGFDAIHVMPQIGPDSVASVTLAAERNEKRAVIQVINIHERY